MHGHPPDTLLAVALALAAPAAAETRIVRFDPDRTSRAELRASLERAGLRSAVLSELPFAAVDGGTAAELRDVPGVVFTHANERLEWQLHEAGSLVFGGAEQRAATYAAGFDGGGQTVAVVDTGTDGLHPDLRDRVIRNVKVLGTDGIATSGTFTHYVECPGACTTDTTSGHGTHVSGTVAGDGGGSDGFYTGIAPGAGIVGLGVGDGIHVFHALQAFDYIPRPPGAGHHRRQQLVGRRRAVRRGPPGQRRDQGAARRGHQRRVRVRQLGLGERVRGPARRRVELLGRGG